MAFRLSTPTCRSVSKTKRDAARRTESPQRYLRAKAARWVAFLVAGCPMPVVAADITLQCGDAAVEVSVQAGTATTLALAVTAPAVLEVDEWGRDLAWRQNEDATFSPIALRPP